MKSIRITDQLYRLLQDRARKLHMAFKTPNEVLRRCLYDSELLDDHRRWLKECEEKYAAQREELKAWEDPIAREGLVEQLHCREQRGP